MFEFTAKAKAEIEHILELHPKAAPVLLAAARGHRVVGDTYYTWKYEQPCGCIIGFTIVAEKGEDVTIFSGYARDIREEVRGYQGSGPLLECERELDTWGDEIPEANDALAEIVQAWISSHQVTP